MSDQSLTHIRVWVTDVWDNIRLAVTPDTKVSDMKVAGLREASGAIPDVSEYEVKFRGALILDESRTMQDLGVPNDAPFIILPARRRPVS